MTRYYIKPSYGGRKVAKRINEEEATVNARPTLYGYIITNERGKGFSNYLVEEKSGFATPDAAFAEGMKKLKAYKEGYYSVRVQKFKWDGIASGYFAASKNGIIITT